MIIGSLTKDWGQRWQDNQNYQQNQGDWFSQNKYDNNGYNCGNYQHRG
jgi:hypothetical protein